VDRLTLKLQSTLNDSDTSGVWGQVAPILEEAMSHLNQKERTLLALRFFENKTAAETAALLGIREGAAHKRAARALEKLRRFFLNRGVDSTAVTIAGAISANSIQVAPGALVKSVTAVSVAKGAAASTSTLSLIRGALKLMAWTKARTAVVTGVLVLLAAGVSTVTIKVIQKREHKSQPVIMVAPNGSVRVVDASQLSQSRGKPTFSVGFEIGSARDAIVRQLEQIHATTLIDSPELLRAVFEETPNMAKPMQVELSFMDGKLSRVNYILPKR
jgi:hypothetical protein